MVVQQTPSCCEKCNHVFVESHEAVSYTNGTTLRARGTQKHTLDQ